MERVCMIASEKLLQISSIDLSSGGVFRNQIIHKHFLHATQGQ